MATTPPPSPTPGARSLLPETPDGALRLHDWGLIRASGVDARSFLQGQLTQDVQSVREGQARLAGYCSPKGRLLASFVMLDEGPQDLLLACSADLLSPVLKRLSMYVLRGRCKLTDASLEFALWGLAGQSAAAAALSLAPWQSRRDGPLRVLRLPDATVDGQRVLRALLLQEAGAAPPAPPALAPAAWAALEARSGVARITAATQERFVPQMINLELVGGVSFQKGCYPGQEIVARSQYRGTLKRRAFLLEGHTPMAPGQEVYASDDAGQPAGMVVLAGSLDGERHDALVELKIAATRAGSLHLGNAVGPQLALRELPYVLPAEAAA